MKMLRCIAGGHLPDCQLARQTMSMYQSLAASASLADCWRCGQHMEIWAAHGDKMMMFLETVWVPATAVGVTLGQDLIALETQDPVEGRSKQRSSYC